MEVQEKKKGEKSLCGLAKWLKQIAEMRMTIFALHRYLFTFENKQHFVDFNHKQIWNSSWVSSGIYEVILLAKSERKKKKKKKHVSYIFIIWLH